MSDWGGVHDGVITYKNGTDLEMPGNEHMIDKYLLLALAKGEICEEVINDKASRILRVCFRFGFFDRQQTIASIPNDDPSSVNVALNLAREGIVLLKNKNKILPLNSSKFKKIALIGTNANTYNTGGGSSKTTPFHFVSCFEGLKILDPNIEVSYTIGIPDLDYLSTKSVCYAGSDSANIGLKAEYYNNKDLAGMPRQF